MKEKEKDNPVPYTSVCMQQFLKKNIKIPIDLIALAAFYRKSQKTSFPVHVTFL